MVQNRCFYYSIDIIKEKFEVSYLVNKGPTYLLSAKNNKDDIRIFFKLNGKNSN